MSTAYTTKTAMSTATTEYLVADVEDRASQVVAVVQRCIESLRDIPEFSSSSMLAPPRGNTGEAADPTTQLLSKVDLYQRLVDEGILAQIQTLASNGADNDKDVDNKYCTSMSTESTIGGSGDSRSRMVMEIVLPLAKSLVECYSVLDRVPASTDYSANPVEAPPLITKQQKLNGRQRRQAAAPPPPEPGMLSLQHYTDIGALLELWVCTSILPWLEPHVLLPVDDRVRYALPRSLAGRLAKPCLLWACRRHRPSLINTTVQHLNPTTRQQVIAMILELQQTATVLGQLLLLDRFRPMFLPRHLPDIYAAMLQAEAGMRSIWKTPPPPQRPPVPKGYPELCAVYLPASAASFTPNNPNNPPRPVDAILQAQALQTLLLHGTKAPTWLRQRVARLLTDMASRDLSVIVQVFVHAAKDPDAASLRLARTLASSSSSTPTANQVKNNGSASGDGKFRDWMGFQLISLLDDVVQDDEVLRRPQQSANTSYDTNRNDMHVRSENLVRDVHFVWAVLDQWVPVHDMLGRMQELLMEGLWGSTRKPNDMRIHRSIKRMGALLSSIPPSFNPSKVMQIFFMPLPPSGINRSNTTLTGTKMNLFSALVRIAAMKSSCILKSTAQDDAAAVLRMIVEAMLMTGSSLTAFLPTRSTNKDETINCNRTRQADAAEVTAMLLVYSLAPSSWDLAGNCYVAAHTEEASLTPFSSRPFSTLEAVHVETLEIHEGHTLQEAATTIEQRANVVVDKMLALSDAGCSNSEQEKPIHGTDRAASSSTSSPSVDPVRRLPSTLFQLALRLYFSSNHNTPGSTTVPRLFQNDSQRGTAGKFFRIVSMLLLPVLCEKCPSSALLLQNSCNDGAGIFHMMKLVLSCASCWFKAPSKRLLVPQTTDELSTIENTLVAAMQKVPVGEHDRGFEASDRLLCELMLGDRQNSDLVFGSINVCEADDNDGSMGVVRGDSEILLSVTSIMLSLLIAVMELGTKAKRSFEEEEIISSLPALLLPLAEASNIVVSSCQDSRSDEANEHLSAACSEIAEMAGHALALVASRGVCVPRDQKSQTFDISSRKTAEELVTESLAQAEADLASTQPPIRARGIVELKHLLRGSQLKTLMARYTGPASRTRRTSGIVEIQEEKESAPTSSILDSTIFGILRIATKALADTESYVYLAAIQTVVATADVSASRVLAAIGAGLAVGEFQDGYTDKVVLLPNQRVKIAEALVFIIRRRAAISVFIPLLINLMVYGNDCGEGTHGMVVPPTGEEVEFMHRETHKYFLYGNLDRDCIAEEAIENEEESDKQRLRINTGGPLFHSEEVDVVRAARINVISELVSVAHPSVSANYCSVFVRLATGALRLDASRPVRRAAAYLARELYRSLLREQQDMIEAISGFANGPETNLPFATALMSSSDEDVLVTTLQRCLAADELDDMSNAQHRVFDAATGARCQEALDARQEAVDGGIIAVAQLIAEYKGQDSRMPVTKFLRDLFQQGRDDVIVGPMRGLKIDPNTLEMRNNV